MHHSGNNLDIIINLAGEEPVPAVAEQNINHRLKLDAGAQLAAVSGALQSKKKPPPPFGKKPQPPMLECRQDRPEASAIIDLKACPLGVSRQNFHMARVRKIISCFDIAEIGNHYHLFDITAVDIKQQMHFA